MPGSYTLPVILAVAVVPPTVMWMACPMASRAVAE